MIEIEQGTLNIELREDTDGCDEIRMALAARDCELMLTPHQARILATELIMAVNRAEVRNNLRKAQRQLSSGHPTLGFKPVYR